MDANSRSTSPAVGAAKSRVLITADELCARNGLSLSTINRLVRLGRIRAFQPSGKGGKRLFAPDAIEQSAATDLTTPSIPSHQPHAGAIAPPRSGPTPMWRRS